MATTTTAHHASCGTNPLYAHLYSSKNFISPSFYLPDPVVPLPVSSRPTDKELAEYFARGYTGGSGKSNGRKRGWSGGQLEEEEMLPAVITEQENKHKDANDLESITVENLLPALRGQVEADEASWAQALLSYLGAKESSSPSKSTLLQAFRTALDECEKSVGLDLIKLSWRFCLPRGASQVEKMAQEEMSRMIEEVLEREHGIITLTTLHQCGLSFLLRIALPTTSTTGIARLALEEQLLQLVHRAGPSADVPFMEVHSSSSGMGGRHWTLFEKPTEWMAVEAALAKGTLRKGEDLPRLLEDLHETLDETLSSLELPSALQEQLIAVQKSATSGRRGSSASSSSSSRASDEEEEEHRGREAALAIPSASANSTSASEHRSDSAVAGLGFSPRDERKPLSAPPSGIGTSADVMKGRSGQGSRIELAGAPEKMDGAIIRDSFYDARRDRLVLARLPEWRLV